jgi:hypothetical protein
MARLLCALLMLAQLPSAVGAVYYQEGAEFKSLTKVVAKVSGRSTVKAEIPGANAEIRLPAGQSPVFRVCGVDPTRYKLYTMTSDKKSRTIDLAKAGFFGGSKSVLAESEIEMTIVVADGNCFTITPKEPLDRGEYGFSPVGSDDTFAFGIGAVKPPK